jgi:hypothetical protein
MGLKEQLATIQQQQGRGKEGLEQAVKVCAEAVASALKIKSDEVALLLLTTSGNTLKFMWPLPLYKSNSVLPANHKTAMAAVVLQTRKGKVDNKMNESFHLKFFENVKGMDTSGLPIQKMVALPLMSGPNAIGVLEASRKGKTPDEAGPNFTPQDAQALLNLAKEMTPGLSALVPENFF